MTRQTQRLFANVTMLLEDLHGVAVEGQRRNHAPDMQLALARHLRAGIVRLDDMVVEIALRAGEAVGCQQKRPVASHRPEVAPSGAGRLASGNPFANPGVYLLFNPPDPSDTKTYPLGELSGSFKAGDMSRTVEHPSHGSE